MFALTLVLVNLVAIYVDSGSKSGPNSVKLDRFALVDWLCC